MISISWLFFFIFFLPASSASDDCTLECAHGLECQKLQGTDHFLSHKIQSGKMIQFCACPSNYVGVACDIPVLSCQTDSDCPGLHTVCNVETSLCDNCALPKSINSFTEHMCRHPITEYCEPRDQGDLFCTNGGKCQDDFLQGPPQEGLCRCPPEFTGTHCETLRIPENTPLPEPIFENTEETQNGDTNHDGNAGQSHEKDGTGNNRGQINMDSEENEERQLQNAAVVFVYIGVALVLVSLLGPRVMRKLAERKKYRQEMMMPTMDERSFSSEAPFTDPPATDKNEIHPNIFHTILI